MSGTVVDLQNENAELAEALANQQRALDELQQQQALLAEAILNLLRGRLDAAQFGANSVEAMLVALNPVLQGKVHPSPFVPGRSTPRPIPRRSV